MIASDLARYTMFTQCLVHLRVPPNTDMRFCQGTDLANNRNRLVASALDVGTEWVIFLDDDMLFPPDHLMRLLAHDEFIVASLYTQRSSPFGPIAFKSYTRENGYVPVKLSEQPKEGLVPIVGAGTGGMLIRAEVFHAIEYPWFEKTEIGSEDLNFCQKALAAGFDLYLDMGAAMGHCTTAACWPTWSEEEGGWTNGIVMADGSAIYLNLKEATYIGEEEEAAT